MFPELRTFLIKFAGVILISPLIGYAVLQIVLEIEKARKSKGKKKWLALFIIGFAVAVLLGWLQ